MCSNLVNTKEIALYRAAIWSSIFKVHVWFLFPQLPKSHAEITGTSYHIWFLSFIFLLPLKLTSGNPSSEAQLQLGVIVERSSFEVITSLISDFCCSTIRFHSDCGDFAIWRRHHHGDSINVQAYPCLSFRFCSRV